MFEVFINVTGKLLLELLTVILGVLVLLLILYAWDKTNPRHFERTMKKLARHFR